MISTSDPNDLGGTANPTRRMLLAGMLSGYAASLIPWALSHVEDTRAAPPNATGVPHIYDGLISLRRLYTVSS